MVMEIVSRFVIESSGRLLGRTARCDAVIGPALTDNTDFSQTLNIITKLAVLRILL
jgi:hypothetical protein